MSSDPSSSSTPPDPPTKPSDASAFERWRQSAAWLTGLGLSPEDEVARAREEKEKGERAQWERCEKWKGNLLRTSPSIVFMLKHMSLLGYPMRPSQMLCRPCSTPRSGAFCPEDGSLLLCQDRLASEQHMEDTIVHELVHAYDRAKFEVNWGDCRHHACTEIRANSLSGDCRWTREVARGHFHFTKHHQACVKRRAITSLRANPACSGEGVAEKAVNEVWESCFTDTRPFDEIY